MTNSLAIKNLSIALEALSRINGAKDTFVAIHELLLHEVEEAHKENHPIQTYTPTNPDDDIPF